MDRSIALIEFSKHGRRTSAETVAYAQIEVGLKVWNPHRRKRTPVSDCIDHACLADYREHELEARAGFHVEMDDVEAVALTKSAIQRLLYDDVRAFHRDLPADRGRVFSDAEELAEHVTIDHAATPMDQSPR